jgi:hypothetical protein
MDVTNDLATPPRARATPTFRQRARAIGELLREIFADRGCAWEPIVSIRGSQAEKRSIRLLEANLSPAQRKQYEKFGYFEVIGGTTGKCYRIRHGYSMNIEEVLKDGSLGCRWCFSPRGDLPAGDVMLAQKLALELYECEALLVANRVARGNRLWTT